MNTFPFEGTLGRDPEVVANANGNGNRTRLRIAVDDYRGPDREEKTHWIDVTVFGSLGLNVANSLKKGHRVIGAAKLDTYAREVQIDGEDKTLGMVAFVATSLGPSLRWQEADVRKGATGNGDANGSSSNGTSSTGNPKSTGARKTKSARTPAGAVDDDDF